MIFVQLKVSKDAEGSSWTIDASKELLFLESVVWYLSQNICTKICLYIVHGTLFMKSFSLMSETKNILKTSGCFECSDNFQK